MIGKYLFLVAYLLLNSLCLSVGPFVTLWGIGIFSAAIKDKQLKFLVKILMTYAFLIYILFCPSIYRSCFKRCKRYFFKISLFFWSFAHSIPFFVMNTKFLLYQLTLSNCLFNDFLCFAAYECWNVFILVYELK